MGSWEPKKLFFVNFSLTESGLWVHFAGKKKERKDVQFWGLKERDLC